MFSLLDIKNYVRECTAENWILLTRLQFSSYSPDWKALSIEKQHTLSTCLHMLSWLYKLLNLLLKHPHGTISVSSLQKQHQEKSSFVKGRLPSRDSLHDYGFIPLPITAPFLSSCFSFRGFFSFMANQLPRKIYAAE